jgi:hypothetical protein
MVKLDLGENQVSSGRERRCIPKVLGYVTGDMREFANWLKGIYVPIPWRNGRSSFGEMVCGTSTDTFGYIPQSLRSIFLLFIF